jgi:hypothetical protein
MFAEWGTNGPRCVNLQAITPEPASLSLMALGGIGLAG